MPNARGDAGSVLILALVFVITVGGVIAALADWVMNDLSNSTHFSAARSLQYAASSATNFATESIRYNPLMGSQQTLNASPPSYCWGNSAPSEQTNVDGVAGIDVWCSTAWTPLLSTTRTVTFSACLDGVSATNCAANPVVQAVVTFDDYPPGSSAPNAGQCNVYCGTGMTIKSWAWSPVVPTVTSISPTTGPTSGGTSSSLVDIQGSGFVTGSTVTFIEESGGVPTSDNATLPATNVTLVSSNEITAEAPAITEGTTYFVAVSASTGTSPYGPNLLSSTVFTYSLNVPSVSSVALYPSGNSAAGPTSGGNSVLITGTNFYAGATVNFVEQTSGSPAATYAATDIVVTSPTTITATSPAVSEGSTYFVSVTNAVGTSPTNNNCTFTYSTFFPLVSTVLPKSASTTNGGIPVTISGTSFYKGMTVTFVEENNGTPNGASVPATITSGSLTATSVTVTAPAITSGTTYFVEVTTPGGTSTNQVIFTYP